MFLVGLLSWWYGEGWRSRITVMSERISSVSDYFSITLLLRTLFSPFRQISVGSSGRTLSDKMRALFDRTLSRIIGAIVRAGTIIIGAIAIVIVIVINIFILILWPLVPLFPAFGLILSVIGWVPSWR